MDAYENLGKILKECDFNPEKAGQKIVGSLVPLIESYSERNLQIICHHLREGKLLAYIFAPQHLPGYMGMFIIRTQLSFQIMSSIPTIDNLLLGDNGSYILVQDRTGEYHDLYFLNGKNRYESVRQFNLTKDALLSLLKKLYPVEVMGNYQPISSLSEDQIDFIEKITGYVPTISYEPSMNEDLENWDAIIPNVTDFIINNCGTYSGLSLIKRIHRLGVPFNLTMGSTLFDFYWSHYSKTPPPQEYISQSYVIMQKKRLRKQSTNCLCTVIPNVDQLWVVKEEADILVATFASRSKKSKKSLLNQIQIYEQIKFNESEILSLKEEIMRESADSRNQRITETTNAWIFKLQKKFPNTVISREPVIKMIHKAEKPIYDSLNKKQVGVDTYVRKDRNKRKEI